MVSLREAGGAGDPDDAARELPQRHARLRSRHYRLINQAVLVLERNGPAEGRRLVDTVTASRIANMKELRPPSAGRREIRVLLVFDPWRSVVLLVARENEMGP